MKASPSDMNRFRSQHRETWRGLCVIRYTTLTSDGSRSAATTDYDGTLGLSSRNIHPNVCSVVSAIHAAMSAKKGPSLPPIIVL